jgi:hypothetical protein
MRYEKQGNQFDVGECERNGQCVWTKKLRTALDGYEDDICFSHEKCEKEISSHPSKTGF